MQPKVQNLVQNLGNYWPKQSFTLFQLLSGLVAVWVLGPKAELTSLEDSSCKAAVTASPHQCPHEENIWPASCWRRQLPQPMQFLCKTIVQLLHTRLLAAVFFSKTVFFLPSRKLPTKTSNHIARSCEKQLVLNSIHLFSSSLHGISTEPCWQMEPDTQVPTALHHSTF